MKIYRGIDCISIKVTAKLAEGTFKPMAEEVWSYHAMSFMIILSNQSITKNTTKPEANFEFVVTLILFS